MNNTEYLTFCKVQTHLGCKEKLTHNESQKAAYRIATTL